MKQSNNNKKKTWWSSHHHFIEKFSNRASSLSNCVLVDASNYTYAPSPVFPGKLHCLLLLWGFFSIVTVVDFPDTRHLMLLV